VCVCLCVLPSWLPSGELVAGLFRSVSFASSAFEAGRLVGVSVLSYAVGWKDFVACGLPSLDLSSAQLGSALLVGQACKQLEDKAELMWTGTAAGRASSLSARKSTRENKPPFAESTTCSSRFRRRLSVCLFYFQIRWKLIHANPTPTLSSGNLQSNISAPRSLDSIYDDNLPDIGAIIGRLARAGGCPSPDQDAPTV